MKPMLTAFAATIVIAFGANVLLGEMGFSAAETGTGSAVRLSE